MKLRLLDDSIRMRLSRSEVVAASESGAVECSTRFPDGSSFAYALETQQGASSASASYENNRMVVRLPATEVANWAADDEAVSLTSELDLPGGAPLTLLVEKDFRCISPREGEDQSDLFSNPQKS